MPASPTHRGQFWITKGHILAVCSAVLFIAVFSFFVGMGMGQRATNQSVNPPQTLLPNQSEEDSLQEMLRLIEDETNANNELSFPTTLTQRDGPAPPQPEGTQSDAASQVHPVGDIIPTPPARPDLSPTSGWAIHIQTHQRETDADAHVENLLNEGMLAFRMTAMVAGRNQFRVWVGGFPDRETAEQTSNDLEATMRLDNPMLVNIP